VSMAVALRLLNEFMEFSQGVGLGESEA